MPCPRPAYRRASPVKLRAAHVRPLLRGNFYCTKGAAMDKALFETADLAALNDQQRAAVEAVNGPVLLLAVPGSGKTTVLITRLGYMTEVCGIAPEAILTMTYTVAATQEMRARFAARFGGELAARLEFRTINGVAARIIALYSRMYGRTPPELIRNESETTPLLMRLWQDTNHEYPAESTVKDLRTAITYIKNMCLTDAELDELETDIENLPDLYRGYQKALKAAHKMDYDDQLCFALQILRGAPAVAARSANGTSISASMSRRIRPRYSMKLSACWRRKAAISLWSATRTRAFTASAPPTPRR